MSFNSIISLSTVNFLQLYPADQTIHAHSVSYEEISFLGTTEHGRVTLVPLALSDNRTRARLNYFCSGDLQSADKTGTCVVGSWSTAPSLSRCDRGRRAGKSGGFSRQIGQQLVWLYLNCGGSGLANTVYPGSVRRRLSPPFYWPRSIVHRHRWPRLSDNLVSQQSNRIVSVVCTCQHGLAARACN